MSSPNKIASLELARVVAIVAIVVIHSQVFLTFGHIGNEPWLSYIVNQLARFAVPLFFIISGYLIAPKLLENPWQTAKQYCSPLMMFWLVWSVIALLMPFNMASVVEHGYFAERSGYWNFLLLTPLNSLLEGGLVHLWFIPSLVIAVFLCAFAIVTGYLRLLLPIALALYIYGVLAGSYQVITEIEPPFFTRNGPFFSLLMVAIGLELRVKNVRIQSYQAIILAALGMIIHFSEAAFLHDFGQVFNMNDYLFGTALWASGMFLWFLANPKIGNTRWVQHLASWSLAIYLIHLLVVILMFNLAGILGWQGLLKDALVFIGALSISYVLARLLERSPLAFIVVRRK
ncbi:fucose 4-O-acetylase [Alginatibacterium sediminis]|uniref:Fucose 4-O-acetylase n=1 Tax=Alginatibacterium sediminis TaxID=2164068 RepID=A0A420EH21_9ALTE|nr:acyltransferase family protein [Alginatibacterium sediminis]RKF19989.1 fucose 4-O-acetylase [Alginatibacterium sediminis]